MLNKKWLDDRIEDIGLARAKSNDKWYYDQWITTYGILINKLCTVPEKSGLWNVPGLKERNIYFPNLNDTTTCWHGRYYKDCNLDMHIVAYGCKWWHFFPFQNHVVSNVFISCQVCLYLILECEYLMVTIVTHLKKAKDRKSMSAKNV